MTIRSKEPYLELQEKPRNLHLSATDNPDKEIGTEIIFHILEKIDDLFIEIYPHNEFSKATGVFHLQFRLSSPEWYKLIPFLMEEKVEGVNYPIK
jgi:hypothetical protein